MNRSDIQADIIKLIESNPLNEVEISPIIFKYTDGKDLNEQGSIRTKIMSVLKDLKDEGYIVYNPSLHLSSRSGNVWFENSGLIRSTNKFEKERKSNNLSFNIGDNFSGNINTGHIQGDLNQINNIQNSLSGKEEEKLKELGITDFEIAELKKILLDKHNDKTGTVNKIGKWFAPIMSSLVTKGLTDNLPALYSFLHSLTN